MEDTSAIGLMNQLPENKSEIATYFAIVKRELVNGNVDFMRTFLQIKALSQLFKQLETDSTLKDMLLTEAEKYNQKSVELNNAKLNIKEVGVKYDFSKCSDITWETLDVITQRNIQKRKERESFLKTITPEMEIYGEDGIQLNPPVKSSTTQVVITLK